MWLRAYGVSVRQPFRSYNGSRQLRCIPVHYQVGQKVFGWCQLYWADPGPLRGTCHLRHVGGGRQVEGGKQEAWVGYGAPAARMGAAAGGRSVPGRREKAPCKRIVRARLAMRGKA